MNEMSVNPDTKGFLEVRVRNEVPKANRFILLDQEKIQAGLGEWYPFKDEIRIILKDTRDGYGGVTMFNPKDVEIYQGGFVELAQSTQKQFNETSQQPEIIKQALIRGEKISKSLLRFIDHHTSLYPDGMNVLDMDERDMSKFNELLELEKNEVDDPIEARFNALSKLLKIKVGEIITHEATHVTQSARGAYKELGKKLAKYLAPYYALTVGGMIGYELLRTQGLIPANYPSAEQLMNNGGFLLANLIGVIAPSAIIMRDHVRLREKEAYENAFRYGECLVDSIAIDQDILSSLITPPDKMIK
jgi:hypothetical protein